MADDLFQQCGALPNTAELVVQKSTIGEQLKSLRLSKEMSLSDASKKSKVPLHTIEQLESNDFTGLSMQPHYIQGIIEQLCMCYGASSADIVSAYQVAIEKLQQESNRYDFTGDYLCDGDSDDRGGYQGSRIVTWIFLGAIVLIIGIVIAGWVVSRNQRERLRREAPSLNLPSLIERPSLPLKVLEIPRS